MAFIYYNGRLSCVRDGQILDISELTAGRDEPLYLYDRENVRRRIRHFIGEVGSAGRVCYAAKANSHPEILKVMAAENAGADVVSAGEMQLALANGVKCEHIVFSGVGKSSDEIRQALRADIGQINVESFSELKRIAQISRSDSVRAPVALRLNPNIEVNTHPHIRTGQEENKFGVPAGEVESCIDLLISHSDALEFKGLAVHIGSQIMDLAPIKKAAQALRQFQEWFEEKGLVSETLDVGGGLGLSYESEESDDEWTRIDAYIRTVRHELSSVKAKILFEPGRILVARAGLLLARVEYIKSTGKKRFVILNTGMHHLLRPALYQARHRILPLKKTHKAPVWNCEIVGPLCESSDILARDYEMPQVQEGDWLAILDVGAYGRVMASEYNARPLPDEIIL